MFIWIHRLNKYQILYNKVINMWSSISIFELVYGHVLDTKNK